MPTETSTKAVRTAYDYLVKTLLAGGTPVDRLSNFRAEEVQIDKATKNFKITLSYEVAGEFQFDKKRELKDFQVTPDGTTVVSMTIRKP